MRLLVHGELLPGAAKDVDAAALLSLVARDLGCAPHLEIHVRILRIVGALVVEQVHAAAVFRLVVRDLGSPVHHDDAFAADRRALAARALGHDAAAVGSRDIARNLRAARDAYRAGIAERVVVAQAVLLVAVRREEDAAAVAAVLFATAGSVVIGDARAVFHFESGLECPPDADAAAIVTDVLADGGFIERDAVPGNVVFASDFNSAALLAEVPLHGRVVQLQFAAPVVDEHGSGVGVAGNGEVVQRDVGVAGCGNDRVVPKAGEQAALDDHFFLGGVRAHLPQLADRIGLVDVADMLGRDGRIRGTAINGKRRVVADKARRLALRTVDRVTGEGDVGLLSLGDDDLLICAELHVMAKLDVCAVGVVRGILHDSLVQLGNGAYRALGIHRPGLILVAHVGDIVGVGLCRGRGRERHGCDHGEEGGGNGGQGDVPAGLGASCGRSGHVRASLSA